MLLELELLILFNVTLLLIQDSTIHSCLNAPKTILIVLKFPHTGSSQRDPHTWTLGLPFKGVVHKYE